MLQSNLIFQWFYFLKISILEGDQQNDPTTVPSVTPSVTYGPAPYDPVYDYDAY